MKRIILPILLFMMVLGSHAQERGKAMQERIKAQKVAFITERLDLSAEEAQKFWPVYNEFESVTEGIRRNEMREIMREMRSGQLSDSKAKSLLDEYMNLEDKMHEAKKKLVKDLSGVIPPQKIIKLKAAEDAFNKKLLQMLQQRRENMQKMRNNRNNP